MCLFSGPVREVYGTKIFGRIEGENQYLVYEMTFSAESDVAMMLPIPVVPGSAEDAVRFISLESYKRFFRDLDKLFPEHMDLEFMAPLSGGPVAAQVVLEVHEVGAFEASFVPTISDFERLDPRFRLPEQVWGELGGYDDFGFAVFKLSAGNIQHAHPMAFSFPTRGAKKIFFPTVHVHDGKVHAEAEFDHKLYCQTDTPLTWEESNELTSGNVELGKVQGILVADKKCYRQTLRGVGKNADVYREA